MREHVEGPEKLAGVDVVAADVFGRGMRLEPVVAVAFARFAAAVAAHDDYVVDDEGAGISEVAGLVGSMAIQRNAAVLAEVAEGLAGLGVDRVEIFTADGNDALARIACANKRRRACFVRRPP